MAKPKHDLGNDRQKCSRLQVISVTCYATLPHRIERKLHLTLLGYLIPMIESWSPLRALICLALIQCLWNRSKERGPWVCRISGLDLGAAAEKEAQYVGQQIYQDLSLNALNWWVSVCKLPRTELLTAEEQGTRVKSELGKYVPVSQKCHPRQTTLMFL